MKWHQGLQPSKQLQRQEILLTAVNKMSQNGVPLVLTGSCVHCWTNHPQGIKCCDWASIEPGRDGIRGEAVPLENPAAVSERKGKSKPEKQRQQVSTIALSCLYVRNTVISNMRAGSAVASDSSGTRTWNCGIHILCPFFILLTDSFVSASLLSSPLPHPLPQTLTKHDRLVAPECTTHSFKQ